MNSTTRKNTDGEGHGMVATVGEREIVKELVPTSVRASHTDAQALSRPSPAEAETIDKAAPLVLFRGSFVSTGEIRRVFFEAKNRTEAVELARVWNVGVEFEVPNGWDSGETKSVPECEAYSLKEACRLLGGVSAITVYRWVVQKKLDRVPATRKVLITRKSIQRLVASKR